MENIIGRDIEFRLPIHDSSNSTGYTTIKASVVDKNLHPIYITNGGSAAHKYLVVESIGRVHVIAPEQIIRII